MAPTL
jgi:hypothetical protein